MSDRIQKASRLSRRGLALCAVALGLGGSACAQILGLGDYSDCCEPIGVGKVPQCVYCDGTSMSATGSGGSPATSTGTMMSTGGGPPVDAHCKNGKLDDDETDQDCGGADCTGCDVGKTCKTGKDCESLSCPAGKCLAPSCTDKVANADETDTDCGGKSCPTCDNGKTCLTAKDCASGSCTAGTCRPWATDISVGADHACVVRFDGKVACWGANNYGQLGDGTSTNSNVPVVVKGLNNMKAVVAGGWHTCAIDDDDTAWCWGLNGAGMLGDGDIANSLLPKPVAGGTKFKSLALSVTHTCAVSLSGGAFCWGSNFRGALGIHSSIDYRSTPAGVDGLSGGVSGVSVGVNFACAVLTTGAVKCWGANDSGQLGDNSTTDTTSPVSVTGLTGARAIACGSDHACILDGFGGVQCWGSNGSDQLADGTTTNRHVPVHADARLQAGFSLITSADSGTCAMSSQGLLYCWGALGDVADSDTVQEKTLHSRTPARAAAGGQNLCALDSQGAAFCLGINDDGELGNGSNDAAADFVPVEEN